MDDGNRLGRETSPYLRQHADNPVHWLPWGPRALARARSENKPILLSIGYSACHWCHVMAHESFEDETTAALMNELFVNVKVDREERPDLDKIYQTAHQLLTQRGGGWPLTMFLTPQTQLPFFGGTYFPPAPRHGLPGFADILRRVAQFYAENFDEITSQGEAIRDVFRRLNPTAAGTAEFTALPVAACRQALLAEFDPRHGGFGSAPKFPHPQSIERMLRQWRAGALGDEPDRQALFMAMRTLQGMAYGGLFDHLGGGFCRYSVDERWEIPHFEKMLYDNGALLALYAQAWRASGDPLYAEVAAATADWALAEMRAPGGGFYSSLDADSEGEEGRFYVWTEDQLRALLDAAEHAALVERFGLQGKPNFEGSWHLRRPLPDSQEQELGDESPALTTALAKLRAERATRVRPGLDDKQLTSWNALLIRGLAIAARALERDDLAAAAREALSFIQAELWRDGQLFATYADGRARFDAYLDDHVLLIDAVLELLQTQWDTGLLDFARALADRLLAQFHDPADGGFYFTGNDHETLIHRPKPLSDEATPAGNGIAAQVLNRLGHLLGETRYLDAAEGVLQLGWEALQTHPEAHCSLVTALEEHLEPGEVVILRGDVAAMAGWQKSLDAAYNPRRMSFAIPADASLPDALATKQPDGPVRGYICRGTQCSTPIDDLGELVRALS